MNDQHREALIASIHFDPPSSLSDEERRAWDQFQEGEQTLRQIEQEKRGIRNARQRQKNRGRVSSVASTEEEKAHFDARKNLVTARLNALRGKHDERELGQRLEYERSKTQWTLIETGQWALDGRVIYSYSQPTLDGELNNCLHTSGSIEEVFINRQRLNDDERAEFLAAAIRADEDHRAGR